MDLGLNSRSALVLAGGGGLGGAIARRLAAEGAHVSIGDLDLAAAERNVAAIRDYGGRALALELDLGKPERFADALSQIHEQHGDVEVLVNITGGPPPTPVAGLDGSTWIEFFQTMVLGLIQMTDLVLPSMRERGWGRIITSTSSGVIAPISNLGLSNSLRLSLVGWSKTLANELGATGVTVNTVIPGRIATGRIRLLDKARAERQGVSVEEVERRSTATIPMRRYGEPDEYAAMFAFLASTAASYITGAAMRVDGGLIAAA